MICSVTQSLNSHLSEQEKAAAKEKAIKLLAEQMSCASSFAVAQVCMASSYEFSYKNKNNLTNGSDEFNDMFYKIAEKLINSVG